jgi:anti-sigma-K factor RskA
MLTRRTLAAFLVVCFGAARAQDQAIRVVVTVEAHKDATPPNLTKDDVLVSLENQRMRVTNWEPIQNDRTGLELWLLIDDGTDTSLGNQLEDLRKFVLEQPATTAVGRNGRLTSMHVKW